MKKSVKSLEEVATIVKPQFETLESVTKNGKKCVALVTTKRLETADFKRLMADIQIGEGYGFMKYYPEQKARYITATGIDAQTLVSLASQYTWKDAELKQTKAVTKKATKKSDESPNTETPTVDPELFAKFLAFQDMLKKG